MSVRLIANKEEIVYTCMLLEINYIIIASKNLSPVHTKQLVAAIFVAATNLPVCIGLQLVSCNFQKLLATVFWFRAEITMSEITKVEKKDVGKLTE